ncbi:MAG TPA: glycosyltransferase family 1 protein [Thermoanaerobaculia bacterium]|nr:glycosyltransferase family 1 protein [Thermoanaerobaculia bacterium]
MRVGIDARKIADFGIGTYIRGLLRGLVELGTGDEYVALAPRDAKIPAGIEHVIIHAPHYSLRELFAVGRAADRAKLDLFHAPHYVVPFTRVPLVVTIHDLIHLHQPLRNPIAPLYARVMLRRAVNKARCILTVSETVKQQLETELGAKRVVVTPNGVETQLVRTTDNRQPTTAPTFLFLGNDKPHKNVDALIEAFTLLRRDLPDARLVLAGASFERFAGRDGVERRGFVPDAELASLFTSATALVMPSREEGFGLPAAEAMACGTAVITSTAAALVEITGDAALHVDADDRAALADAMLRVARDPSLRASLAAKGIARASLFTWKRCAEATRNAWTSVL